MHYYNARYYDDHLGQFISPDTLVPDATSVLSYNRFMYTVGNPLNANDPSGHSHCLDCVGGGAFGGGFATQSAYIAARRTLITIGAGGAGYTAGEVIKELNADEAQESFPLPDNQPSATGFPTITDEDDGLLSTPSSPAPGMHVLTEPLDQAEVGSNVYESRAKNKLQPDPNATGSHTTFKRDPLTGMIIGYETYVESDPRNPNPWESQKRVDLTGAPHFDKKTGTDIPTPHVHQSDGSVRPALPDEIPQ